MQSADSNKYKATIDSSGTKERGGDAPKLSVCISTCRSEGLRRVEAMNLPEVEGVEYVVSWQLHDNAPVTDYLKSRKDVAVIRCDERGLGNNRNNALAGAQGEVVLTADDDLAYSAEQLRTIMRFFADNPEVEIASFRYEGATKRYPERAESLSELPKGFGIVSFETAFRNPRLAKQNAALSKLRYNGHFGLGSPLFTAGEDDMLIFDAQRLGLRYRFVSEIITTHRGAPTGRRKITDNGVLKTDGCLIAAYHPLTWAPRVVVNAWRIARSGRASFMRALHHLTDGALRMTFGRKAILNEL